MLAVKYSVGQAKEKNALGIYGTKQQENLTYFVYILPQYLFLEGGSSI
jgi:hypothetical protein